MEVLKLSSETRDHQTVVTLLFSRTDKSVNVLDEVCMQQLEAALDQLEAETPDVLVLRSGLENCFIAGADLDLIAAVSDAREATALAHRGQQVCRRIEMLPCVSIAVVQGACMGGGLEVAMACDHIVSVEHPKTQLALPEIKIGIHPGFGGCVRLPQRVGWITAVDMILSGRALNARQAKRQGLTALSCHPEQVDAAITKLAATGKRKPSRVRPGWLMFPPAKWLLFRQVESRVRQKVPYVDWQESYPSIPATLELLQSIVGSDESVAYALEAESLGRMAVTPSCKNLIRVFHLGESLRKQGAVQRGRDQVTQLKKTSVFGAGVMGSGIAWVAAKSTEVDLHEVSPDAMARGLSGMASLRKRDEQRFQKIRPVLDRSGLASSDIVIEAVLEEIDVKKTLWKEVEAAVSSDALLLTNTSSLSVSVMQQRRKHPERIAGMHFFNPAPKMPLVEVVAGKRTSQEVVDQVAALAVSWGKYPVITSDSPGFFVNRCLMPYMVAALRYLEQGQKPEHIDGTLKVFGMPMGALELADRVGLDICMHVGEHLSEVLSGDRFAMPDWLSRMVADGVLGAKSGAGFFEYQGKEQKGLNDKLSYYLPVVEQAEHQLSEEGLDSDIGSTQQPVVATDMLVQGCLIPMLVEALQCLAEGVIEQPDHMDAAFIYGVGFPPFRGGVLRYFASQQRESLIADIKRLGFEVPQNLEVLDAFAG